MSKQSLSAIPTNVITGFLGVGKTTAIINLLRHKPNNERWAVLVNEFGEVGIDGGMFKGSLTQDSDVFIREVPGGCMCCTSGLPMQMALNMLLAKAKPHRLLIEPTGLGHPKEVLDTLTSNYYKSLLDLHQTITLVDARKITEQRYITHETFLQQMDIADVIIANKSDLYETKDEENLKSFLSQRYEQEKRLEVVSQGFISPPWLEGSSSLDFRIKDKEAHDHDHDHDHSEHAEPKSPATFADLELQEISEPAPSLPNQQALPENGVLSIENKGEGFYSKGWIFRSDLQFDSEGLKSLMASLKVERIKGVFITEDGIIGFNSADGVLSSAYLDEAQDSRVEVIDLDATQFEGLEDRFLACLS